MSKFSKALNKIQEDRAPGAVASRTAEVPSLHLPEQIEDQKPTWGRGIKTIKDAKPDHRIVAYYFPNSLVNEQYRMLRTSLKNRLGREGAQVILVSSSVRSEGKSITAANLALSFAEDQDVRVALIDADLRRGKIGEYLGFGKKRQGLAELLTREMSPKQAFYRNSRENLVVMPCGEAVKNAAELVGSQKFRILVAELRTQFDYIFIDSPPIMSVADAGIMAKVADGVLFAIQIGRTPKTMIAHANLLFKQAGAKMLGYVLTHVEYHSSDYRYYDNYYYNAYDESDKPRGMKEKAREHMKKAQWGLDGLESRLNKWWKQKMSRRGGTPAAKGGSNTPEQNA